MQFTRRTLLTTAASAAALPFLPRLASAAGDLVIPTPGGRWEKFWRESLLPDLQKQTGINGQITTGLSRTFATNLRATGKGPSEVSLLMVGENFAAPLREEGYFAPITVDKVPNLASVYPFLRIKGDLGVRAVISPIGIGYRTDLVKTPPKSWADLWTNPEFKGKTGLYQIGAVGGALFFALAAKLHGGSQDAVDVAFTRIKELLPFRQADFSPVLSTLLARGDINVAMIDFTEIVALKQKGVPVEMVVPTEGVLGFESVIHVIKTGPSTEEAFKYINFMLDPDVQRKLAAEFYTAPTNSKTVLGPEFDATVPVRGEKLANLIMFDWNEMDKRMPEIVARWNREIR